MRDDALSLGLYARVGTYRGPVLIMYGDGDFVPVQYAEKFGGAYGAVATLEIVPGADHGWAQVAHREHGISRTVAFITAHAQRKAPA